MKKKTKKATEFLNGLHKFLVASPQFRNKTAGQSEIQIQTEIRPLIIRYLENHFASVGYKDAVAKANKSFYWGKQQGVYPKARRKTFGCRNYPDFIIQEPTTTPTTPTSAPPDPLGVLLTPVDILVFLIIDAIALGGGFGIAVVYERFRKMRRLNV